MNEPMKITFSQGIHEQSATQKETLGTLRILNDGRKFRYAKNGGVALVAGRPVAPPVAVANHQDLVVVSTAAVGKSAVTLTLGGTAATLNQYKDGYLQVLAGAAAHGEGMQYLIDGNNAQTSTTGNVVVQLREQVRVVITAGTSKCSLIYNPWANLVAAAATTEHCAGVPPIAVTASYYFWSQTGGIACAELLATTAVGLTLIHGAAGFAAGSSAVQPVAGWVYATPGVVGNCTPVYLTID